MYSTQSHVSCLENESFQVNMLLTGYEYDIHHSKRARENTVKDSHSEDPSQLWLLFLNLKGNLASQ